MGCSGVEKEEGELTLRDEGESEVAVAAVVGYADHVVPEVGQLHVLDGQGGRCTVHREEPATVTWSSRDWRNGHMVIT